MHTCINWTNNLITKCASQCYGIWILPHIISLSYLMCIKEEFPKTKISNACIHTLFYIIYNYGKKIFWKILTQSDYMWWYFWKIACILICIIEQFRANFSYRFSSAIYYKTLNFSLDFLVTMNLYTTLWCCLLFFSCFNTFPLQVYAPCTPFICCHDNGDRLIVLYSAVFVLIFWSLAAVVVKAMYRNSNVCS